MKMKKFTAFVIFASTTFYAYSRDELVPAVHAEKISITAKQDGNAIRMTVSNKSSLVVTGLIIECHARRNERGKRECVNESGARINKKMEMNSTGGEFSEISKLLPNSSSNDKINNKMRGCINDYGDTSTKIVYASNFNQKILPGSDAYVYGETIATESLGFCIATEIRGREKRLIEF